MSSYQVDLTLGGGSKLPRGPVDLSLTIDSDGSVSGSAQYFLLHAEGTYDSVTDQWNAKVGIGKSIDLPGGEAAGFAGFGYGSDGAFFEISGNIEIGIDGTPYFLDLSFELNIPLDDWLDGPEDDYSDGLGARPVRLIDPIVLDLDGNGIELTGRLNSNVYFDMDGDGIRELTGWLSPADGLLAIDGNSNGEIDNINELIGDLGRSGFAELNAYDLNKDEVIDSSDAVWSQLKVWVDGDSDGLTDTGELRSLASLNIRAIDLNYTEVNFTAEGNRIHEQSVFEYTNGTTGLAADIWFDVSNVATDSTTTLTGNVTIDDLPDIRGHGDVESLRSVMLTDGALTTLVAGFVAQDLSSLGTARAQAEQIIYRWADVQSVDPASRGGLFDGRKLAALESFLGTEFIVQGNGNPIAEAVASLTASWEGLLDGILARLLMSGPLGEAMAESAVYAPEIDRLITVHTPAQLLASFAANAPVSDGLTVAGYWAAVLPVAREIVQDVGGTTTGADYASAVSAALAETGLAPFADLLDDGIISAPVATVQLKEQGVYRLSLNDDVVSITGDLVAVYARAGNDVISVSSTSATARLLDGGSGNDQLYGGLGNDWLSGGIGSDTLAGGTGNDVYTVDSPGDVVLELPGAGSDEVRSSIAYTLSADLENLTLLGTAALTGTGNLSANQLIGNTGANVLKALAGDDSLDGGLGADSMYGGTGRDVYVVDNAGDLIIEEGKNGSYYYSADWDIVQASVSYTAAALVEEIQLQGTAAINATGNSLNNRLSGNAGANILDGGLGADQMSGGAGDDVYIVGAGDSVAESADQGTDEVRASVSFALGSHFERLVLLGADDINATGNELANRMTGNTADNRLDGGAGADTMVGRLGNDTYIVDNSGDSVVESTDGGIDSTETSLAAYTLSAEVENLRLYTNGIYYDTSTRNGTGNTLANTIEGNDGVNVLKGLDGDDQLSGNGGNDTLEGGNNNDALNGGTGADRMTGGSGNDLYYVDDASDTVIEAANGGTDSVISAVSLTLSSNVENLTLIGYGDKDGVGNALANTLVGNDQNNRLDGGAGADTLTGGLGNDTYTVDSTGDQITEAAGAGIDTVRSSISLTLGANFEHLTLLGTAALTGTGNLSANQLIGNAGANVLKALAGDDSLDGGLGADSMYGGMGRDVYVVDNAGDLIIEEGKNGGYYYSPDWDIVQASVSYTAAALVEEIQLQGTAAINATGNNLNNRLYGNAGANILDGGSGADQMWGGAGDDVYVVDSGDYILENLDEGMDEVRSSVGFSLSSYFERLVLLGVDDINGTGNELANRLTGNAGDNVLNGSTGADTMAGGLGNDTYVLDNTGDSVAESAGGGIDGIETSLATYTLGAEVENLRLYTDGIYYDTSTRNGTGNTLANTLDGNDGVNVLSGLDGDDQLFGNGGNDTLSGGSGNDLLDGGTGDDRMVGGTGDDVYRVNSTLDVVVETANAGTDTVETSLAFILGANLENLVLTGTANVDGQGNGLNNRLSGNNGNNNLDGGAGADTLAGGAGNDVYTVDNAGDVVLELPDTGVDEVRSSVSFALGLSVENLQLLGSFDIAGAGNAEANIIIGNAGKNTITGGLGRDTMSGNAGADKFVFLRTEDSANTQGSADRIVDFSSVAGDLIDLSAVDAIYGTSTNNSFTFIGSAAFSAAGQIRTFAEGDVTYMALNTDSNLGTAEMMVSLTGSLNLSQSDFIL